MALLTDRYRADLLDLVDASRAVTKLADSGISRAVFGSDQAFIKRLRRGDNVTTEKARALEVWLRQTLEETASQEQMHVSSSSSPDRHPSAVSQAGA